MVFMFIKNFVQHSRWWAVIVVGIIGVAIWVIQPNSPRSIQVASAKGGVIGSQMLRLGSENQQLWLLALSDPVAAPWLTNKEISLLSADPLPQHSADCPSQCIELTFYNDTDGGTVTAIYDKVSGKFVSAWAEDEARPHPGPYLVERVVNIAAKDEAVKKVLGNLHRANVAMLPMSTWLMDNDCNKDWCVDLTFHDPSGSGKIYHVIVNLTAEKVARTFYSRGRAPRAKLFDDLDPNAPRFTDGCHEEVGWNVCWQMTAHDGVDFYNATYNGNLIFTSAKIGQIEAFYPSWPGGYRDEIGTNASVPPLFNTRIARIEEGFEVRQLFTEPFDWPNCICCYRYEQVMIFYADGKFEAKFISHGPGCEDLSEYRPFWRIDIALNGEEDDQAWYWNTTGWSFANIESEFALYDSLSLQGSRLVTMDQEMIYEWKPAWTDPLGLDDGKLFVVQKQERQGETGIKVGPANSYQPPRQYLNGEALEKAGSDLILWYIPILKTKMNDPWWCQPDPEPDFSPCHTSLTMIPMQEFRQPTEAELAEAKEALTPLPTLVGSDATPTRAPTPRAITGQSAEEIILNAGCGACHEIGELGESGKVGPSLNNIGRIAKERVPGQSAENYLYNSILYPNLFLAPQCPNGDCLANIMPATYYMTLKEEQINTLVSYLMTLQEDGESAETVPTETNPATAKPTDTPITDLPPTVPTSNGTENQNTLWVGLIAGGVLVISALIFFMRYKKSDTPH